MTGKEKQQSLHVLVMADTHDHLPPSLDELADRCQLPVERIREILLHAQEIPLAANTQALKVVLTR